MRTTISPASSSNELFSMGWSRQISTRARTITASALTRAASVLSSRRSASTCVASTVWNEVTWGISRQERVIFCAISRRAPRTGIRSSTPSGVAVGASVALAPRGDVSTGSKLVGPLVTVASPPAAATLRTSSRVILPSGPVPLTEARSMPRSRASFRTTGVARAPPEGVGGTDAVAGLPVQRGHHAGHRRGDLDQGLGRVDLDQRLVEGHRVALGDLPLDDLGVLKSLTEVREVEHALGH